VSRSLEDSRKGPTATTMKCMSATTSIQGSVSPISTAASRWFLRVVGTNAEVAPAIARVALGLVMFPHGAQKALGWFGGYGFAGTYGFMTAKLGIPGPLAALAIAAEFLGALALIVGVGGRVAAFGILSVMLVAIGMVHLPSGFFMNWTGAQAGEGFEYHLLAIALAVIVLVRGSGARSVDLHLVK
jgi:putative oxidoreductase